MSLVKYRNDVNSYFPSTRNSLLDRFLNDTMFDNTQETGFVPAVDILESDKNYELEFAVPGFKKDAFDLKVEKNVLMVSGERKFEEEKSEKTYKSVRTSYGSFKRSFSLPENVAIDKIEAGYKDGILNVIIPKDETKLVQASIKVK